MPDALSSPAASRDPLPAPSTSHRWIDVLTRLTVPRRADEAARPPVFDAATPAEVAFEGERLRTWHWHRAGPAVLLVHGWESRSAHWAAWLPPLLDAGFSVTAMDLPAHGDSGGQTSSALQAGRAVLRVAAGTGPLHGVVGHSMGSAATLYAFAHGLQVQTSVHLAGPASLPRMLRLATDAACLDAAEADRLVVEFARRAGAPVADMDLPALTRGFRHRALLLHDPADREVPFAASQAIAAAWPLSRLVEVTDVGHRRILSDAQVIRTAVAHLVDALGAGTAVPPASVHRTVRCART